MGWIAVPTSASQQGFAFEHMVLSYCRESNQYRVQEWSSYLHGKSGAWYQCDGIVEDRAHRWLVEAKFFANRPATARDIDPRRREQAAKDLDCTGIIYVSLNGFCDDMLLRTHDRSLAVRFLRWDDMRADVMSSVRSYASVFLDRFEVEENTAHSSAGRSSIRFENLSSTTVSTTYPEFVAFSDRIECWLRRMPKLALQRQQTIEGEFRYQDQSGTVSLVPARQSDLSLDEAWRIEDALSGYSARVHSAVKATAQAMAQADGGLVQDVQRAIHALGWATGISGVRSSLSNLVLLGFVRRVTEGTRVRYRLTPLGRAYVAKGEPDDDLFAQVLRSWPPYAFLRSAILRRNVSSDPRSVAEYFRSQYSPYEPYAKCLFNQNKSEGLAKLYEVFG